MAVLSQIAGLALFLQVGSLPAAADPTADTLTIPLRAVTEFTLSTENAIALFFMNPIHEAAVSLFHCVPDEKYADVAMSKDQIGGIMLLPGSTVRVKNKKSATVRLIGGTKAATLNGNNVILKDGDKQAGDLIRVTCSN